MSLLYSLEGWPSSPSSDNIARSFNNDTLVWSTAIAAPPFTGQVASTNQALRQKGGWDGNFWYVIGPDGKLYRYNPTGNSWSSALVSGAVIIGGTVEDQNWFMTCDGRFLYLLDSSAGFRRYDPATDTMTARATIPGTTFSHKMTLAYDGNDTIYGFRGGTDNPAPLAAYTISTDTWALITSNAAINAANINQFPTWSAFLQGKWFFFYYNGGGNVANVFAYDPNTTTWTTKTALSAALASVQACSPSGEMTDAIIRLWPASTTEATIDYNVGTDAWSRGPNTPATFNQGTNAAVTRLFQPIFTWYESDGTTQTANIEPLGTLTQGDTLTQHFKVKTAQAHAAGATVNVPTTLATDAAQPVTICETVGGTYGTSFTTAALNAGDEFDVFVKLAPTTQQTAGLSKTFSIRPVGN